MESGLFKWICEKAMESKASPRKKEINVRFKE